MTLLKSKVLRRCAAPLLILLAALQAQAAWIELRQGPFVVYTDAGAEQARVIGWVGDRLFTVICEFREDRQGEYCHLVTLWRSTREERELYEANS